MTPRTSVICGAIYFVIESDRLGPVIETDGPDSTRRAT